MTNYTPTTDQVIAYIRGNAVMAGASVEEADLAAQKWLDSVKREAFDRGYDEGYSDGAAEEPYQAGCGSWDCRAPECGRM